MVHETVLQVMLHYSVAYKASATAQAPLGAVAPERDVISYRPLNYVDAQRVVFALGTSQSLSSSHAVLGV